MFFGALALYYRATTPRTRGGTYGPIVLAVVMFGVQVGSLYGPLPKNATELALTGLGAFVVLAIVAQWIDGKRC